MVQPSIYPNNPIQYSLIQMWLRNFYFKPLPQNVRNSQSCQNAGRNGLRWESGSARMHDVTMLLLAASCRFLCW